MRLAPLYLAVACYTLGSITGVFSFAPPRGSSGFRLERRQNDDVTPDSEVNSTDTGKLRECKEPKPVYIDQDTVEWNEVDNSKTKFNVTVTTLRGVKKTPPPKDRDQGRRFVVDHVLELEIVVSAFDNKNRQYDDNAKAMTDKAWKKARQAVNGVVKSDCKTLAEQITVLDNLLGVAEKVNLGKEQAYMKILNGKTDENLDSKWNDYLKVIGGYLADFKSRVETTIDNTAQALETLTGEEKVKDYFSAYCKAKYKEGQDYVADQVGKIPDDNGSSANQNCLASGDQHTASSPKIQGIKTAKTSPAAVAAKKPPEE
ncbi:MAG: hypothetical protein Q9202_006574 [Teloschistes flavicans]